MRIERTVTMASLLVLLAGMAPCMAREKAPALKEVFKEHFLIFSVDIEGDVEITDFQGETMPMKDFSFKQYRVRATPVFAFFDLNGKLVTRYTGATRDAAEFLWLGEYVVAGVYKEMTFSRYKRQRSKTAQSR